jgi:hypothetical protein
VTKTRWGEAFFGVWVILSAGENLRISNLTRYEFKDMNLLFDKNQKYCKDIRRIEITNISHANCVFAMLACQNMSLSYTQPKIQDVTQLYAVDMTNICNLDSKNVFAVFLIFIENNKFISSKMCIKITSRRPLYW